MPYVAFLVSPCFARRGALRALDKARQDFFEGGDTGCRLEKQACARPCGHAPSVQPPAEQAGGGGYSVRCAMATGICRERRVAERKTRAPCLTWRQNRCDSARHNIEKLLRTRRPT